MFGVHSSLSTLVHSLSFLLSLLTHRNQLAAHSPSCLPPMSTAELLRFLLILVLGYMNSSLSTLVHSLVEINHSSIFMIASVRTSELLVFLLIHVSVYTHNCPLLYTHLPHLAPLNLTCLVPSICPPPLFNSQVRTLRSSTHSFPLTIIPPPACLTYTWSFHPHFTLHSPLTQPTTLKSSTHSSYDHIIFTQSYV